MAEPEANQFFGDRPIGRARNLEDDAMGANGLEAQSNPFDALMFWRGICRCQDLRPGNDGQKKEPLRLH